MGEIKHTPGPWLVQHYLVLTETGTLIADSNLTGPISIFNLSPHLGNQHLSVDEVLANVRLIAAAPQMYDALEAVEWIENPHGYGGKCPWCWNNPDQGHAADCQRQVALAAARGES